MREDKSITAIGIDVGGTFTDFVVFYKNKVNIHKILSTPEDQSIAFFNGLKILNIDGIVNLVHGTTVATNALLERKGAKTALITTSGFKDILDIGRQNRKDLYSLVLKKIPPLVNREFCYEISERIDSKGNILENFNHNDLDKIIKSIDKKNIESVAVSFLFSFLNPIHEKKVKQALEKKNLFISLSSDIIPEYREYERTSTTVMNAYVSPVIAKYLNNLEKKLDQLNINSLRIMQSNGGSITSTKAKTEGIRTILSGPAGGVIGAHVISKTSGFDNIISFDMGGTSTDVSLIMDKPQTTTDSFLSGFPSRISTLDIHTVGSGGGSIVYKDAGGIIRVGPESAGSDPGPICYGSGNKITVTDANLLLGRILPDYFLDGKMKLDIKSVKDYFEEFSKRFNSTPMELAKGIIKIVNIQMSRAIRKISIERGYDLRKFTLFAFGGGGPMHAAEIAENLGISEIIIPIYPGVLSAMGMLLSNIVKEYSITAILSQKNILADILKEKFDILGKKALSECESENNNSNTLLNYSIDMRYSGQSYEINVPISTLKPEIFIKDFHKLHQKRFGYSRPEEETEIVTLRLELITEVEKPEITKYSFSENFNPEHALVDNRNIFFDKLISTPVYNRELLTVGSYFKGPALIIQTDTTTLIPPEWSVNIDEYKNILLNRYNSERIENGLKFT